MHISMKQLLFLTATLAVKDSAAFQSVQPQFIRVRTPGHLAMPITSSGSMKQVNSPHAQHQLSSHHQKNSYFSPLYAGKRTSSSDLNASSVADARLGTESSSSKLPFPIVLWRFTRPHTLIGSALAIPALHLLAAPTLRGAFTSTTALSALFAMVPSLLMNLYITGLNQITDVEIDKINKPNLPIAAGDLSLQNANIIVIFSLIVSLAMGSPLAHPIFGTQGLNVALWGSMILGTMYSLPPFRLKRFPVLAATCIVAVRGAIINAGFYAHAKATALALGAGAGAGAASATVNTSVLGCLKGDMKCLLSSSFFAVFGIVIALMKDVPDAKGDARFNIRSFTVRIGEKKVFTTMRRLLTGLFFGVGAGFTQGAFSSIQASSSFNAVAICRTIVAVSSFAAGVSVRQEAKSVDAEDSSMVYKYYMHLWKIFYASYLVLPFAR